MILEIELPSDTETERRLLGALLLMVPFDRDLAVKEISAVWFADPWHRDLFYVLVANRRRDFGAEMFAAIKAKAGGGDPVAWWLAMLFVSRDGEPTSGNPKLWKDYATTLERLHGARCKLLILAEQIKEIEHAARIECRPLCEPTVQDAKRDGRAS